MQRPPVFTSMDSMKFLKMKFLKKNNKACAILVTLVVMAALGAPAGARAQQGNSAPAIQQPAPEVPPPKDEQPPEKKREQSRDREGIGRQLAHETREAAGEEKDETAEFKESPSVVFVAHLTGLSLPNAYLLSVLLNFAAIAILLIWAARKYLPGVFSARTAAIQKAMQEAQKASEEARHKLAEIETRLKKLDVEIGMMRDAAEREAGQEEARIHEAAQQDARKIVESAQQEIASAAKVARRDLTVYAADLAIGLAEKQIRVDADTDQALVRKFAGELGTAEGSAYGNRKEGN